MSETASGLQSRALGTTAPTALEAFLDLPCSVKEVVGAQGFAEALRTRAARGDESRLTPMEGLCQGCRAQLTAQPFSCSLQVPYPLDEATEEWALSLLPMQLDTTAGRWLRACFENGPFDGRWLLRWRKDPKRFAVRPSALREWKGSGFYLTSEQALEPLLFNDAIPAGDSVKLALIYGLLDPQTPDERVHQAIRDPQARRALLSEAVVPDLPTEFPPASRAQGEALRGLLEGLRVAGRIDVSLAVFA